MITTRKFSAAVFSAFLLFSAAVKAQIPEWKLEQARQAYSEFGVKAGGNFQQITGYPFTQAYNPGGIAGAYLSRHGKTYGVKLEATVSSAHYTTMDAASHAFIKESVHSTDSVAKGDFTALSLNVPLMLEIRPSKHFLFELGVQYTHLLMMNDNNNAFNKAYNTDKVFKNDNYAMIFGIEHDITLNFKIGATFTEGLTDINNGAFAGLSDQWLTQSAQVYLVYKIKKWYPHW